MRTLILTMGSQNTNDPLGFRINLLDDNYGYPVAELIGLSEGTEVTGDAIRETLTTIRQRGWCAIKICGIPGAINNKKGPPTLILDSGHDYVTVPFELIASVRITRIALVLILVNGTSHTFDRFTEKPHS